MSSVAIGLEVLPAGYGDSLLLSCPVGKRTWRLLVDTGPDECWPQLRDRLARIPVGAQGQRHIDLAVISHIDHDHIGAASLLFSDRSLNLTFGDIWFNAPPRKATRGVAEGHSLAGLLGAAEHDLPWNKAFSGAAAVTAGDGRFLELPAPAGAPRITLLSPTPKRLEDLFKVWDRELERLRKKEVEVPQPSLATTRGGGGLDLKSLAAKVTATDKAPANGSSIAMLIEHLGASVLLAADAFSTVLVPSLRALALHRNVLGGLAVDAIKLSHHGSRANVTTDLLKAIRADHYIVSTNGAIFRHPDDEAIARVAMHGGGKARIWFNYGSDRNRRWGDPELRREYGYEVMLPDEGHAGVSLELRARNGAHIGRRSRKPEGSNPVPAD